MLFHSIHLLILNLLHDFIQMDVSRMNWKNEMENMLSAIDRQTTRSLRVIRLMFKRCGQSLPPDFKQHFLQVSSDR